MLHTKFVRFFLKILKFILNFSKIIESIARKTHNEFMLKELKKSAKRKYNITNYQHRIVPIIKKFSNTKYLWQLRVTWDEIFGVPTAEVFTTEGTAYSFNMMEMKDMFWDKAE